MEFEIHVVESPQDVAAVRGLWEEYWASLGLEPEFQGFAEESRNLPGIYGRPGGLLFIARQSDKAVGTIALRPLDQHSCEVKRLFILPELRGKGLGRALLDQLIIGARSMGYQKIYGDSLPSMVEAQRLYRSFGFRQAGAYSATPTPGAIHLELILT